MAARFDNTDGRLRGRALQARRLRVWSKDPSCAGCGRFTDYPAGFQLDHIKALVNKGDDTDENSQVLCLPCHEAKTRRDLGQKETVQIGVDGWPT
ncbi:HNH endonuclease [Variovorax soli]|uniref:HNH endonuclease n=1 Tax=Variovorax soli TaxID=376815 RepID=UPI000837EDC2|nr:HNH endonuclease signature motif containing protein [Variovorax soli]